MPSDLGLYSIAKCSTLICALLVFAYLIGSVLSAVWASKIFNLPDPREYGSRNPGTSNISRSKHPHAKYATALTLAMDVFKGLLPVYFSYQLGYSNTCALLVGTLAIIGHLFPIFHNFRGGKGMATAMGVLAGISPKLALCNTLVWLISFWIFRISSISSIASVISVPILFLLTKELYLLTPAVILICMFLLYKHLSNIYILTRETYNNYKKSLISSIYSFFSVT